MQLVARFALLVLAATGAMSQSAPAPAAAQCTPLATAAADNGFTSFLAAFNASGLTAADLAAFDEATFFIPTNDAFAALLSSAGLTLDAIPSKLLQDIILAHIVPDAEIFAENITASPATVQSELSEMDLTGCPATITAQLSNGDAQISTAVTNTTVTTANIRVCEGVAHGIAAVLLPCDLATLTAAAAAQPPRAAAEAEGTGAEGSAPEGAAEGEGASGPEGAAEGEGASAPEGATEGEGASAPEGAEGASAPEGGVEGEGAATPATAPRSSMNAAQSPAPAPSAASNLAAGVAAAISAAIAACLLL